MPRFFVDQSQIHYPVIEIQGGDVNHIKNVLRMAVGDTLTISDGSGQDYFCTIEQFLPETIKLNITNQWESFVELPVKLYLFQALPKADKMELIIQKAVELGAYELVPVASKRCVVKLDDKKEAKKLKRWQDIAESGAKQSGRSIIPRVHSVLPFKEALAYGADLDVLLIPYERAENMEETRQVIKGLKGVSSIGVFIGPEGGFEPSEVEAAVNAGAKAITLGHRILRTETAGLAALSILMFEMEA